MSNFNINLKYKDEVINLLHMELSLWQYLKLLKFVLKPNPNITIVAKSRPILREDGIKQLKRMSEVLK